jgi:hypothetical protein
MIWDIELPTRAPRFTLQVWDKNYLSADDSIAEAVLNFRSFFRQVFRARASQKIARQWINLSHPNYSGTRVRDALTLKSDNAMHESHFRI